MTISPKLIVYVVVGIILLALGYYFLGEMGLLGAAGVLFGSKAVALKKEASKLEAEAVSIKKEIQEIEKKEAKLKSEGVENKSAQEEVDYWKNQ